MSSPLPSFSLSENEYLALKSSWLLYVRQERKDIYLPHKSSNGPSYSYSKSSISYPHWPPTTWHLPRGPLPIPLSFGDFIPTSIVSRWLLVGLLEISFA